MCDYNINKEIITNPECNLCQGSGIATYFDMNKMPEVGEGTFTLGYLCEKFGAQDKCPNCFPFNSTINS